jgi:hypothetical protein
MLERCVTRVCYVHDVVVVGIDSGLHVTVLKGTDRIWHNKGPMMRLRGISGNALLGSRRGSRDTSVIFTLLAARLIGVQFIGFTLCLIGLTSG